MLDLLLAAAALQNANPCIAITGSPCPWRLLGVDTSESFEVWYDPASWRRTGGSIEITTRVMYRSPQQDAAGRSYRSSLLFLRLDCQRRTAVTLLRQTFTANGDMLENSYTPNASPLSFSATTIGERLINIMCSYS